MKKIVLLLCLGLPVLAACTNQSSSTETSSSNKVLIEVDKVEKSLSLIHI